MLRHCPWEKSEIQAYLAWKYTKGKGTGKGDVVPGSLTYSTELKQGQKLSVGRSNQGGEDTGNMLPLHHIAVLQPCG